MAYDDYPYIEVVFDTVRPYPDKIHTDIVYHYVRLVVPGKKPFDYKSGDYQQDIDQARADSLGSSAQERNVGLYEMLVKAKPESRDVILAKAQRFRYDSH